MVDAERESGDTASVDTETNPPWHARELDAVFAELDSSPDGLSRSAAESRLEHYGLNEIADEDGISPLWIFVEQYSSVLIWVLIVAAGVMAVVGHTLDAAVIAGIVVFITLFGFAQDYRAEQSIHALRELATKQAVTIRGGEKREIDVRNLVPGDVVLVEAGDSVPADARLMQESNLSVDEAALTGESMTVSKETAPIDEATPLAERTNMLYKDTVVARGSGTAVVVGTGSNTEIGKIATALREAEDRDTPFQTEMDTLGKIIAVGVIGVVAVIGVTELFVGDTEPLEVFLTAVGVAVSAVPEGLPAVVTLSLALGARRMADQNALIRRLPIVEALGSVDVICTDKTGTLTEEEMTVKQIITGGKRYRVTGSGYDTDGEFLHDDATVDPEQILPVLRCGILCNNVDIGTKEGDETEGETYLGDPTEIALFVAAQKAGLDHDEVDAAYPRVGEVDFTSDRKRMTTLHQTPENGYVAYMKGAPEAVIERCDRELIDGEPVSLTDERRAELAETTDELAEDALRVLGFAYLPDAPETASEDIEDGMVFLGLQGMIDPPRSEVPDAIAGCLAAGINIVMVTGDNAMTARAIGEEVGLNPETVLTGNDVDDLSEEELEVVIEEVDIFARTSPEHKTRILKAFQNKGHTVAMTGDGVNDAPAVKNADVGIAMGIRGTDVTEQASDIVLLDDNFATIRNAVHGGRRIFDNVRKFVNYLLSGNGGEVTMIFTGSMAGLGLVITPIQILWINIVTDGIPAVTMGVDPAADDVMERKPRPPGEGVITKRIVTSVVGIAIFMMICLLPLFSLNYTGELLPGYDITGALFGWNPTYELSRDLARTVVFTGFVVFEIVRIQAIRHRYGLGFFSNRWLVFAILIAVTLQLLVLYTPTGQLLFSVEPLALIHWVQIGIAVTVFAGLMSAFVIVQDRYFDRY